MKDPTPSGEAKHQRLKDTAYRALECIQYLLGFFVVGCAVFLQFYGVLKGFTTATREWGVPGWGVFVVFFTLLLILAYCEAAQVALMIVEKVHSSELATNGFCMRRAQRSHALAKANVNNYLIGRQFFTLGIAMFTAQFVDLDHSFHKHARDNLGPFFGGEVLVSIFVDTGLCGSLIVLSFGEMLPELLVTKNPTLMFRLPGTYELVWCKYLVEKIGVYEFANVISDFVRWMFSLPSDIMAAGNETRVTVKQRKPDGKSSMEVDSQEEQVLRNAFWPTFFREKDAAWWIFVKYAVGTLVFFASIFFSIFNVVTGGANWCKYKYLDTNGLWKYDPFRTLDGSATSIYPDVIYEYDDLGNVISEETLEETEHCFIQPWVMLAVIIPLLSVLLMFLEGLQIASLALEKTDGELVKQVHQPAHWHWRVMQKRYGSANNVQRYLVGSCFGIMFGDFLMAQMMGIYGLGYVAVMELTGRLVALNNPMWWVSLYPARLIFLLGLFFELIGVGHFAWGVYHVINKLMVCCCGLTDDAFSVGSREVAMNTKNDPVVLPGITEFPVDEEMEFPGINLAPTNLTASHEIKEQCEIRIGDGRQRPTEVHEII